MAKVKRVELTTDERSELKRRARSRRGERRHAERAQIVLAAAEGLSATRIARRVGCSERTVKEWRGRFERERLKGLNDRPRSGRPLTHDEMTRARLIALACTRPPETEEGVRRERWTYRELSEAVGMAPSRAYTILREADVRPHLTEQWVMTDFDQEGFEDRAGEICGLYLDPPEGAIVVSIDEKSGVQAKGQKRPDALPEPGKPARRDNEYVRNGTQNLFACLKVHSGAVTAMASKTRNRFDFIRFLDELDAEIPAAKEVIAILDNLATHRTEEVTDWLAEHPRWRFAFTPTHASWLNQVELFFSILQRRLIKHGVFTSEEDLATQMLAFVEHYNLTAQPFQWTYTGKVLVA